MVLNFIYKEKTLIFANLSSKLIYNSLIFKDF